MELSDKQKKGLEAVITKYNEGFKYAVISGYAGSGKSTLIRFIINALPVVEDEVVYCAYTGKACTVLKEKGNHNVQTLHHLLYEHYPLADGTFKRVKVTKLSYKIVVVDECSMVDKEMVELLLSHDVFVIFLGDPFQLPSLGESNNLLDNPDVFLDEIHRQALDNEIIKFSMDIRESKPLPTSYKGSNVQIYSKDSVTPKMMLWADQILCSTNAMRTTLNNTMRMLKEKHDGPQVGDKIICLKNDWDEVDTNGEFLVNGTIGTITDIKEGFYPIIKKLKVKNNKLPYYVINLELDNGARFENLIVDKQLFETGEPYLNAKQKYSVSKNIYLKQRGVQVPHEFTYAYAITVHKSQGSQFGKVLVFEENFPFDTLEHKRSLYTAITRASNKVVIVRK